MDAASSAALAGTAELALTPKAPNVPRAHVLKCCRTLRQRPDPRVLIQKADALLTKSHPFVQWVTRFPEHCSR
jgi:hypothetical protein